MAFFIGKVDMEMIVDLAKKGLGDDKNGYRKEYLELLDLSIEWGEGLVLETKDDK